MAHNISLDQEALDNMFDRVDVSKDGTISKLEMSTFLQDLFGQIVKSKNRLGAMNPIIKKQPKTMNVLDPNSVDNDSIEEV